MNAVAVPPARRASICILALLLSADAAWGDVGDPLRRSMWSLILNGVEWPAYFIFAGSLLLVALVVDHFLSVRVKTIAPPELVRRARAMIENRRFRECYDALRKSPTFFGRTLAVALRRAGNGFDAMQEAARDKAAEQSSALFRRVEYMNILGNLGPLMGLLGTVYGMIIAFNDLGASGGQAGASGDLARGISLALVNTMLGLALAIIGLGFFGWCRNRVDVLTMRATVEVLDLLEFFRPAPTGRPPGETRAAAPAAGPLGVGP